MEKEFSERMFQIFKERQSPEGNGDCSETSATDFFIFHLQSEMASLHLLKAG